jgi:pimeloyl-ACP methyl ester carboxylesterase
MKFLFRDKSFSFETLRAAGYGIYGGADLGEVLATAKNIRSGSERGWHHEWKMTAARVEAIGEQALAAGHRVSGREAMLRASNYYRTAEFFLRTHPATDPEVTRLSTRARQAFATAVALFDTPVEAVSIPYECTTLPGYLFLVDDSGRPRPTVVYTSGYDSTLEEAWFAIGAAAVRRGYNVLAYDGPGQGAALREQGLVFRPDWEAALTPVLDFALTRKEIAPDQIALFGYSLGGFLVARAAAFDHRVAALILDDGIYDFHAAFSNALPGFLQEWIDKGLDARASRLLSMRAATDTGVRWGLRNGVWALGADSFPDLVRKARAYTLKGTADRITAPALVMDAEDDHLLKGQPQLVHQAMVNSPATLVTLTAAEGAGEHVHVGALARAHQIMFDWLDTTLASA